MGLPAECLPMRFRVSLILFTLSAVVVTLAALLVCAELLLRFGRTQAADELPTHMEQTPYTPIRLRPGYSGVVWERIVHTNRWGFRDEPDFPVEPAPGETRVLSLGDSIGYGVGIAADEHYSKVIERRLNEADEGQRWRVVNAGSQGYSPSGYAAYLRYEGLELKPKLAMVEIELCNDVTDEALIRWETDGHPSGVPCAVRGGRYAVAWDGILLGGYFRGPNLPERTYLWASLVRGWLNLSLWAKPSEVFARDGTGYYSLGYDQALLTDERLAEGWERLFAALAATRRLLTDNDAELLVILLPARYVFDDAPAWKAFASGLVTRAAQRLAKEGIPFVDMSKPLASAGGAELYLDFAHLTARGNRVVGEAATGPVIKALD